MKERFRVLFSKDVNDFLENLPQKAKDNLLAELI